MAKTPGNVSVPKPKGGFKKTYLIAFNTVSVIAWLTVFWRGAFAYQQKGYAGVHGELGEFWKWTQTLAVMEVIHSLVGMWSPSIPSLRSAKVMVGLSDS